MSQSSLPATILTLRPATADDAPALRRIAELDSSAVPRGDLLVALADGRVVAAASVDTGAVVADPFTRTADLVGMLRDRAAGIQTADASSHELRSIRSAAVARLLRRRSSVA